MLDSMLKKVTRKSLASFGLEIQRKPPSRIDYYPTVDTCQVANLSFLLELFLGKRRDGSFVEVGAFDGITYSNTWGLAEMGWTGLMFEPVPALAAQTREVHQAHGNVTVIQKGVGSCFDELTLRVAGAFTTVDTNQAADLERAEWAAKWLTDETITVEQTTLDEALSSSSIEPDFDVLVVDVEGHEAAVFEGFSVSEWSPKMMIVELEDVHPVLDLNRKGHAELTSSLLSQGYGIVYKDYINTILVRGDVMSKSLKS